MAYGRKYKIQVAAKTEPTEIAYTCFILEKDYLGTEYTFDNAYSPLKLQVLASSDNQFETILPTAFNILVDTTFFTNDLPDFNNTDDRKYWIKVYGKGTNYLVWQGFLINDQVSIPFTTGRTFLSMTCIDGLAMLKSIPYAPSDENINVPEDLSTTITNCLNKINLPDGYNLNYLCDYYSSTMSLSISPFKQACLPPRNFLNSDGRTFKSCYEVLEMIALGFGCRIFQSNGEWWVAAINNQTTDQFRYFTTTNLNGAETINVKWKQREIQPYLDVTSTPFYFQNNVQAKILRKGFPYLYFYTTYEAATNLISDPWLKSASLGLIWVMNYLGTGSNITVAEWVPAKLNAFTLTRGSGFAQVAPIGLPELSTYSNLVLKFDIFQSELTGGNRLVIKLTLNDGTGTDWYLDINKEWSKAPSLNYYTVGAYTGASSSNSQENITIETPPIPILCTPTLYIRVDSSTMNIITIGNFSLTNPTYYEKSEISNFDTTDTTITYRKDVEIKVGVQSPDSVTSSINGILQDASGNILFDWTRQSVTGTFPYLINLLYQQYFNIVSIPQINFNLTLRGLYDYRDNVGPIVKQYPHIIGCIDVVNVYDLTTNSLSVSGFYYIVGVCEFNFSEDILNGTMLFVSNTDITVSPTSKIIYKSND